MTTLPVYKGFQGSVEYDDGTLLIRILHIDDFISTTCDYASKAVAEFRDLVDDYLATCTEKGDEPNRPFKGSFNVRIDPQLHRAAAMAAAATGLTLNAWIGEAVRDAWQRLKMERSYLLEDVDAASIELGKSRSDYRSATPSADRERDTVTTLDDYRETLRQKNIAGR